MLSNLSETPVSAGDQVELGKGMRRWTKGLFASSSAGMAGVSSGQQAAARVHTTLLPMCGIAVFTASTTSHSLGGSRSRVCGATWLLAPASQLSLSPVMEWLKCVPYTRSTTDLRIQEQPATPAGSIQWPQLGEQDLYSRCTCPASINLTWGLETGTGTFRNSHSPLPPPPFHTYSKQIDPGRSRCGLASVHLHRPR